jgi:hypothetical protein
MFWLMGRKSTYTPEMADEICVWLSQGKTLAEFCAQNGKPGYSTVYAWLDDFPEFARNYARARDTGHDVIAEECIKIADEMPPPTPHGSTDSGYVQWQKNRIWTRTQLLAKWNPKKYGEVKRSAMEVSGPNGGPIQTIGTIIDGKDLDDDTHDLLIQALEAATMATANVDQPYEDEDEE